jgi:hypothetical protein
VPSPRGFRDAHAATRGVRAPRPHQANRVPFACHPERSEGSTWAIVPALRRRLSCWILRCAQDDNPGENGPPGTAVRRCFRTCSRRMSCIAKGRGGLMQRRGPQGQCQSLTGTSGLPSSRRIRTVAVACSHPLCAGQRPALPRNAVCPRTWSRRMSCIAHRKGALDATMSEGSPPPAKPRARLRKPRAAPRRSAGRAVHLSRNPYCSSLTHRTRTPFACSGFDVPRAAP